MPVTVTMPRLSDTMEQGTVVKWHVKEGQQVASGDVIADIETDKATMELQTFDGGTVAKLAVAEGQQAPVGALIMVIAAKGEDVNAAARAGAESASAKAPAAKAAQSGQGAAAAPPQATPAAATAVAEGDDAADSANGTPNGSHDHAANGSRVFASPLARKIAAERGIDLADIEGTGPSGRIVRRDVESFAAPAARATPAAAPAARTPAATPAPAPLPPAGAGLTRKTVPVGNMRRTIAKRLVESKSEIPHYYVTMRVNMDPLLALREQLNKQLESQGVKLSVNDFIVRATALAMHQHPYVNSLWHADKQGNATIELMDRVNIGVAIALPKEGGGLVVATIRDADRVGLRHISAEAKRLSKKAREKGLSIEDMADQTFTVSNLGMYGVTHYTAIINPPNTAILAVGAAIEKPVVRDGQIVIGHEMDMTLSSDHRVIDGAMAAQYLQTVKELLESPAALLV